MARPYLFHALIILCSATVGAVLYATATAHPPTPTPPVPPTLCPSVPATASEERPDTSIVDMQYCQSPFVTPVIDAEGNRSNAVTDKTRVYDVGYNCRVLAGADSKTFVALDKFYGKDANSVWLFHDPTPYGALNPFRIAEADPATFTLIPDPNSDPAEPYSEIYTKDKNHVFALGEIVLGADPQTFTHRR